MDIPGVNRLKCGHTLSWQLSSRVSHVHFYHLLLCCLWSLVVKRYCTHSLQILGQINLRVEQLVHYYIILILSLRTRPSAQNVR